jgi:Fe-S-cluster containining protein
MFSFLDGFMRGFEEKARLLVLEQEMQSGRLLKSNKCLKCGFCCCRRTCIPTPDELKKIAEFLGLKPTKLIKTYFAIDRTDSTYYVKPLGENIKDLAGKFIPDYRTFNEGKCIFLDDKNLCKIYPVRPRSAQILECWNFDKHSGEPDISELDAWEGNELLKQFNINLESNHANKTN